MRFGEAFPRTLSFLLELVIHIQFGVQAIVKLILAKVEPCCALFISQPVDDDKDRALLAATCNYTVSTISYR